MGIRRLGLAGKLAGGASTGASTGALAVVTLAGVALAGVVLAVVALAVVALAGVALAVVISPAAPAWAEPSASPSASACAGVWVVVDSDQPGANPRVGCATSFASGADALASAGFPVARKGNGMLCQLGGFPEACVTSATAYWSYWTSTRQPDGTFSAWTYSSTGADSSRPSVQTVEGWRFGDGTRPPGLAPDTLAVSGGAESSAATPSPTDPTDPTATCPVVTTPFTTDGSAPTASPGPTGLIVTVLLMVGVAVGLVVWYVRNGRRP